jgi:putative chitinase
MMPNKRLGQSQVDGWNRLLDIKEQHFPELADDELAYCLATSFHETGARMQPIKEIGDTAYFTRMYDIRGNRPHIARELGNINPGDGAKYPGMGDVQSTGRNNARRARQIIKKVLGIDVDFEANPKQLMNPLYSGIILYYGMIHGIFTGKKLRSYIDGDGEEDPSEFRNSRRIINGVDRAEMIAGYAHKILLAIKAAKRAVEEDPELPHDEKVATGVGPLESKTAWSAVTTGGVGGYAVLKEGVNQAQDALETAKQAHETASATWDAVGAAAPWILAAIAIAVAVGVILYERRKKSLEYGI